MTNSALWKKVKEWLISSELIEPNIYDEYVKNASIEDVTEAKKAIVVNNDLPKYYLENIAKDLNEKINAILEKDIELVFLSKEEYVKEKQISDLFKKTGSLANKMFEFDNFISGKSNNEAFAAAKSIIDNLGTKWNPLFIYGESGLGKTHLLKAICNELNKNRPELVVKYFTSEDFRKEIIDALSEGFKEIEQTKKIISGLDVLLIDDIQFLAHSGKTNEIFFNIFNSLIEEGRQIVITSDKFPELLNGFDKRLVSRFNQGLSVKIELPDLDTAFKIVDYKCEVAKINLLDESKKFIASNFGKDVRKIEGIINKIEFKLIQEKDKIGDSAIGLDVIQNLLEDYSFASSGEVTIQKIKNIVAQNYGVAIKAIDSKNKIANVVNARHVSMYLAYEILKKSYTEIGISFGGKDHTTVMNAHKKITEKMTKDKVFRENLKKIKKQIIS